MIRSIKPESEASQYLPNTNVAFNVSLEGQEMVKNSLRVSGDLYLTVTMDAGAVGPPVVDPKPINTLEVDPLVGIHGFFNNWICKNAKGNLPPCNNYGRYVKHTNVANMSFDDMGINKDGELMFHTSDAVPWFQAEGPNATDHGDHISFCFAPLIPFNRTDSNISYDSFGNLEIQFYLVDKVIALKSDDATNALGYTIKNLKLHYMTVDDTKSKKPVLYNMYHSSAPNQIDSNNVSIDKYVGGMLVNAVVGSSILKAKENNQAEGYYDFDDLDLTKVQFSFKDVANADIQYPLEEPRDILYNGILALNKNGMSKYMMNTKLYNTAQYQIFGIKYPAPLDMNQNKFSVRLMNDNANGTDIYDCFLFFEGFSQL